MMESARMLIMVMMVLTSIKLISNVAIIIKGEYVVSILVGFLNSIMSLLSSSSLCICIIINTMVILIVASSSSIFPFYRIDGQDCIFKGNLGECKDLCAVEDMLNASIDGGDKDSYDVEDMWNESKDGTGPSYSATDGDNLFREILVDEGHIKARKFKNGMYSDDIMIDHWVSQAKHESKRQRPTKKILLRKSEASKAHMLESTTAVEDYADFQEIEKRECYNHSEIKIKKNAHNLNKMTCNQDHQDTMDEIWKVITEAREGQEERRLNELRRSKMLSVDSPQSISIMEDQDESYPTIEVDELNKRVEEFINKIKRDISSQEARIRIQGQ